MRDLAIEGTDLIVATHGRAFWVLDDISRLRALGEAKLKEPFLVAPAAALRIARSTWSDTPIPPDEPTAANPPDGAVLEYYLPRDARGVVVLEVLDAAGGLVRRYASNDPPGPGAEELARQLIPPYWVAGTHALSRSAGMHRFVWDLRYPAPPAGGHGYPISAVPHATPREPFGPVAAPGNYTVRLTVDGRRLEAPLGLKPDPRVRLPAEGYAAQLRLAQRLAGLLGDSTRALGAARSLREQLKALPKTGAAAEAIHAYDARLEALLEAPDPAPGAAPAPRLPGVSGHVEELYNAVLRADAAPTVAQAEASETTASELAALLGAWHGVEGELATLNARLRAAGLAPLKPGLPLPVDTNAADEE